LRHHAFEALRARLVAEVIERKNVDGGADLLDVRLEANVGEVVAFVRTEGKGRSQTPKHPTGRKVPKLPAYRVNARTLTGDSIHGDLLCH
jgi:hypothetical protein